MEFRLHDAVPVLQHTPAAVNGLLRGLPGEWTEARETPGAWSPFDIVGHLIHADRTNWLTRADHLLAHGEALPFPPFNREGMIAASKGRTLEHLLDEFADVRAASVDRLTAMKLTAADLAQRGRHPDFGSVTLGQLLATWVTHDLSHLGQIVRVMAREYDEAVGPWRAFLRILGG